MTGSVRTLSHLTPASWSVAWSPQVRIFQYVYYTGILAPIIYSLRGTVGNEEQAAVSRFGQIRNKQVEDDPRLKGQS